jgi:hypothetical protein
LLEIAVAKGVAMVANGEDVASDDWVSVGDLARLRGVTHQAVSKRVKSLRRRGALPIRQVGRRTFVHLPSYDRLAAAAYDPAQELRNFRSGDEEEHVSATASAEDSAAEDEGSGSSSSPYSDAVAREKHAKADLAEIALAQKRRELVPARDLERATETVGTAIAQRIASFKAQSGKLYAASKGGEEAMAIEINALVARMLIEIGADMTKIAELEDAPEGTTKPN